MRSVTTSYRVYRFGDQVDAGADFVARPADQLLDFPSRPRPTCWQVHGTSCGDHGETVPRFARTGRLNARVQGKQVGLEGNLVNHGDDLADLRRLLLYPAHGGCRIRSGSAGIRAVAACVAGEPFGCRHAFRAGGHGCRNLPYCGRGLLDRGSLALRASGKPVGCGMQLRAPAVDGPGVVTNVKQRFAHAFHGCVQVQAQPVEFARPAACRSSP